MKRMTLSALVRRYGVPLTVVDSYRPNSPFEVISDDGQTITWHDRHGSKGRYKISDYTSHEPKNYEAILD